MIMATAAVMLDAFALCRNANTLRNAIVQNIAFGDFKRASISINQLWRPISISDNIFAFF